MTPLRIVIFTRDELTPSNDALFRRLAADPEIDVAAIVIDEHPWRAQPLMARIKKHGIRYLTFKLRQRVSETAKGLARRWWERHHPVLYAGPDWSRLETETGLKLYRTPDIHCDASVSFIRSLNSDLGIIVSGRIIKDHVLSIPKRGTINIHKRKAQDYRGGGAVGYWELLAGEKEIAVTIHEAVARVDEGAILAQRIIPIEPYDTLESLAIKAGFTGCELYHETLLAIARGTEMRTPQDCTRGKTYRGAGEYAEARFERELRKRAVLARQKLAIERDYYVAPSTWLKFLAVRGRLRRMRERLIAEGQAPIIVFFYHRTANDAATPGTLALESFVEQVELIRRYFPIIPLSEAAARLRSGSNREVACVITFDDGYESNIRTCIPWLRTLGIPATFFTSIGHVAQQSLFEHDTQYGITSAIPMTIDQMLACEGGPIVHESHAFLHEDCGKVKGEMLERAIIGSRDDLQRHLGRPVTMFAFPKGQRGINIKKDSWEMAAQTYDLVCSAYGGYNFPGDAPQHIKRFGGSNNPLGLLPLLEGFTGVGEALKGRGWGWGRRGELPY